jgi:hypothetical protein
MQYFNNILLLLLNSLLTSRVPSNCPLPSSHLLIVMFLTGCNQKIKPQMNHKINTPPTIMPESFSIATLFPLAAILPNRPADPFKLVLIEENVSDYFQLCQPPILVLPQTYKLNNRV